MPLLGRNIIPAVMILASLWTFLGFLRPQYAEVQTLRADKARYEKAVDDANEVRILRSKHLATYDSFDPKDWEKLRALLPDHIDPIALIMGLQNLASVFAVTLEDFSVHESKEVEVAPAPVAQNSTDQASGFGATAGGALNSGVSAAPAPARTGTLELEVKVLGTYANFMSFLGELEKHSKLIDVSDLSIDRGKDDSDQYEFALTLRTYYLK